MSARMHVTTFHRSAPMLATSVQAAASIPPLTHAEAGRLATTELQRFLALADSLAAGDWDKPTACTRWNVRQITAHVAGACAGFASWPEFRRQFSVRPRPGQQPIDATNARQVADRASRSPAELIAELRVAGPKATATRQSLPALLRSLWLPLPPPLGFSPLAYLTDLIYTRDMWMHRLDICRATGREMVITPDQDGRIIALVVRDVNRTLARKPDRRAVIYELAGPAGGAWSLGRGQAPAATLHLDALTFCVYASGRMTLADARSAAVLSGDLALVEQTLACSTAVF